MIFGQPPWHRDRQRQPIEPEAGTVPTDYDFGHDDAQGVGAAGPMVAEGGQKNLA